MDGKIFMRFLIRFVVLRKHFNPLGLKNPAFQARVFSDNSELARSKPVNYPPPDKGPKIEECGNIT